jgi:hypothetical protein
MATVVHNNFRDAQMGNPGGTTITVDFDADDVRCSLFDITDSGTIDATDSNYGDVNAGTIVHEGGAIGSKTVGVVNPGVFDSTVDYTMSSVTGDEAEYLTLWRFDATPANGTLVVTWDSATTGIPVTPNSGDITVQWNASGIVQI